MPSRGTPKLANVSERSNSALQQHVIHWTPGKQLGLNRGFVLIDNSCVYLFFVPKVGVLFAERFGREGVLQRIMYVSLSAWV